MGGQNTDSYIRTNLPFRSSVEEQLTYLLGAESTAYERLLQDWLVGRCVGFFTAFNFAIINLFFWYFEEGCLIASFAVHGLEREG